MAITALPYVKSSTVQQRQMHAPEAHLLPQLIRFTLQLLHALRGCCQLLACHSCAARAFLRQHANLHLSLTMGNNIGRMISLKVILMPIIQGAVRPALRLQWAPQT